MTLRSYRRKIMIPAIDAEKACDKIQHPTIVKTLSKLGIKWTFLGKQINSEHNA